MGEVYEIVRQGAYLAVLSGEAFFGVGAKVGKKRLEANKCLLQLRCDGGDGGIRFFFKLGDAVRQNVKEWVIREPQSLELISDPFSFGRWRVRSLHPIWVFDGKVRSKGVDGRYCTWSGVDG